MAVNVPTTLWRPTDGNGEMSQSDGSTLVTEAGVELITESGTLIVIEDGKFTPIPATTWAEDDSR